LINASLNILHQFWMLKNLNPSLSVNILQIRDLFFHILLVKGKRGQAAFSLLFFGHGTPKFIKSHAFGHRDSA